MGDFHGYDTSDDYFIEAVWPLASRELRRLSKTRGFSMRGPGRALRGKEVASELSGRMIELVVDVPNPKRGGTDPLVVRADGSYMTSGDGEYSIHMESPFFTGTHGWHEPMSGDPQADAKTAAEAIADMVDDMRFARPGLEEGLVPKGPAPTAGARKAHLPSPTGPWRIWAYEHDKDGEGCVRLHANTDAPWSAEAAERCAEEVGKLAGMSVYDYEEDGEGCVRLHVNTDVPWSAEAAERCAEKLGIVVSGDARAAVPGAPTAARRIASRLVGASRKVHLKVVLSVFAVADDDEGFDLGEAVREAFSELGHAEGLDVQDVTVESVGVTDSR